MTRMMRALETAQLRPPPPPPPPTATAATPATISDASPRSILSNSKPGSAEAAIVKSQLVADKQGDLQYLGPSSLLSFTSEAETLVEERLKASEASADAGTAERAEQSETICALRRLSAMSSKSVNFFPHYGHKELRTGAEGAGMGMPPREETDGLVNGLLLRGTRNCRRLTVSNIRILSQDSPLVSNI